MATKRSGCRTNAKKNNAEKSPKLNMITIQLLRHRILTLFKAANWRILSVREDRKNVSTFVPSRSCWCLLVVVVFVALFFRLVISPVKSFYWPRKTHEIEMPFGKEEDVEKIRHQKNKTTTPFGWSFFGEVACHTWRGPGPRRQIAHSHTHTHSQWQWLIMKSFE